jgi:lactoylglutathione lyase
MEFCWVTINVKDMEQSLAFYRDVVGLRVDRKMKPMPGTEIAFLGNGGTEVELIRNEKNSDCQYGKDISLGFVVDSVERAMVEMKEKGVTIHSGPFQPNPQVKFFYVLDPNGLRVQFVERH